MEGVTNEEEEVLFATKPNLLTLATITLSKPEIFSVAIFGTKASIETLHSTFHILRDKLDTSFTCIKIQDLIITCWTLLENHQVRFLNLGTTKNP